MAADYGGLSSLAARQHRAFHVRQAAALGIGSSTIQRLVGRGLILRVLPGVYAFAGADLGWETRLMALTLATGGWASHRSAARLRRFDTFSRAGALEVAVAHGRGSRVPFGTVHQSRAPQLADVSSVDGIPCAGPTRVLVDLAAAVPSRMVGHAVSDLRRLGLAAATDDQILETYVLHTRRGRPGMEKLGAALARQMGTEVTDSVFEQIAISTMTDAGLAPF